MAVGTVPDSQDLPRRYGGRVTTFVVLSCITAGMGGVIFGYDIGVSGACLQLQIGQSNKRGKHRDSSTMNEDDDMAGICRWCDLDGRIPEHVLPGGIPADEGD